jgi:acyl dehydratase
MSAADTAGAAGLDEVPIWRKGRCFEDFEVGQVFEHHWGRTLTDGDNALFSTSTLALLPLHLNAAYAREQGHPDVVLNPMLVFCTTFGLSVEDLSEGRGGGAFLGVDDLRFEQHAHPGVTITARSTVVATKESASRPHQGIVTWRTEGCDEEGTVLVSFQRTNLIMRREV